MDNHNNSSFFSNITSYWGRIVPSFGSSSSSSSSSSNFSVEIMISGHADLPTEPRYQHGAEEIKTFYSEIEICMFSFAPIAYCAFFWGATETDYRKSIIEELYRLGLQSKQIDKEIFGNTIVKAEKIHSGKTYLEDEDIEIRENKQYRSHTLLCSKTQYEKSFEFYGDTNIDENAVAGIYILKTVRFSNGYTIYPNTNLLDIDIFINFMLKKYKKYILPIENNDEKIGYDVFFEDGAKTYIELSEIISFFTEIDTNNEICSFNIVDLTCSVIDNKNINERDKERYQRRFSRQAHHKMADRKHFGGKKINIKYLPRRLTRRDRKKRVNNVLKSRRLYKKGKYYTRKNVKSSRV